MLWRPIAGLALMGSAFLGYKCSTAVPNPPPSPPIADRKIRLCVAGYPISPPTAQSHELAFRLAKAFPDKFETYFYFSIFEFFPYIIEKFDNVPFPPHLKGHCTSPMCWLEVGPDKTITPIGGNDRFCEWARAHLSQSLQQQEEEERASGKTVGVDLPLAVAATREIVEFSRVPPGMNGNMFHGHKFAATTATTASVNQSRLIITK